MNKKKFFGFTYLLILMFFVTFISSGCGGGGSNRPPGNNPDNPNSFDVPVPPNPEDPETPEQPDQPQPYDQTPTPTPTRYTVTFDTDRGSEVASITVNSGSTIEMPDPTTKEGYIFIAWYKDKNFNEEFTFGENGDKITGNITLYAR